MSAWSWLALAFTLCCVVVGRINRGYGGILFLGWVTGVLTVIAVMHPLANAGAG